MKRRCISIQGWRECCLTLYEEQLQSLDKSRDGLMVTFEHHAKVWRDLEREKERKKEGPLRSGQPGLDQCLTLD